MQGALWVSDLANGGQYTVKNMRHAIDNFISITPLGPFHWNKVVPLKVTCFAWRGKLDRIPSAVNLHRRGINSMDKNCNYCGVMEETTDHLLCGCPATCSIMDWVFRWGGVQHSIFPCVSEVLDFVYSWGTYLKRRRILISICYDMFWCIWRARNEKVFNNIKIIPVRVTYIIKSTMYVLFKHRRKKDVCN